MVFLGVDTWLKLHTQMLVSILGFLRTPIAYKHKFNAIYKQYKDDKVANQTLGNDRHECPFYDALDSWWHQRGDVIKHVSAFANEIEKVIGNPKS
jgi:hypothetical protein